MMLHRNLPQDDNRGLREPNNDGSTAIISTWVLYNTPEQSNGVLRKLSILVNNPIRILIGSHNQSTTWQNSFKTEYKPLIEELPKNIHLVSLRARDSTSDEVILRMMNILEADQSEVVSVDIDSLFAEIKPHRIKEMSLTVHQGFDEKHKSRMSWKTSGPADLSYISAEKIMQDSQNTNEEGVFISQDALSRQGQTPATARKMLQHKTQFTVLLHPLEIKTFLLNFVVTNEQNKLDPLLVDNGFGGVATTLSELPLLDDNYEATKRMSNKQGIEPISYVEMQIATFLTLGMMIILLAIIITYKTKPLKEKQEVFIDVENLRKECKNL